MDLLYATPVITAYCLALTALLGLCMGSFLNCLAWRRTHGESVLKGRSHCTTCGHELRLVDLIPVFSWISTKGTCRYCGQKVSARYPASEILCAVIYVSIVARFGLTLEAAQLLIFASILFAVSITDLDDYLIPNGFLIAAIVVRAAYLGVSAAMGVDVTQIAIDSLIGAVALGAGMLVLVLIADKLLGKESMGGGDIKLFAVCGLYLGYATALPLVIFACVIGLVLGLVGMKRAEKAQSEATGEEVIPKGAFPFGPAIAISAWMMLMFGTQLVSWYLALY